MKNPRRGAPPGSRYRPRPRFGNAVLKTFVWILLAIFVLTSVGVALVTTAAR